MTSETGLLSTSRAVLIGVSAYEYEEFPPIRAARNSLFAMRDLLADPALCGWPPARITLIPNPISATDLGDQLADLAESTTGVMLLYYVGHGVLTTRGELCLTVSSTRPNRPKISGLTWEMVAEILRACPASVRLAILDCCFAGQAIEALSGGSGPGLADIAHVDGVYTLTATTRNRTAHVPPPDQQDSAYTSFTGELLDLIRAGIPDGPAQLTFGDLFPVLRRRLQAKGLPVPSQRGTDTAHQFPFTTNAADHPHDQTHHPYNAHSTDEKAQAVQVPAQINSRAVRSMTDVERIARSIANSVRKALALILVADVLATAAPGKSARLVAEADKIVGSLGGTSYRRQFTSELENMAQVLAAFNLDMAERVARSIVDRPVKASALATVAETAAASDPDRAERIARSIVDNPLIMPVPVKAPALARVAESVAASDPDRAERIARSIADRYVEASAHIRVAETVAAFDPDRAERIAESIADGGLRAWALGAVAAAVVNSDPDRATRLTMQATSTAQSIMDLESRARALARVLAAVAGAGPGIVRHLVVEAEAAARAIVDEEPRALALARVAEVAADSHLGHDAQIIGDAARAAESITGTRWESFTVKWWGRKNTSKGAALKRVATVMAASDPDRAERLAQSITNEAEKAAALERIAEIVAAADPDRAERLAQSITNEPERAAALERIAETVAAVDPTRAENIARSIADEHREITALGKVAEAVAVSDPDRAEYLARSIIENWPGLSPREALLSQAAPGSYAWNTSVKEIVASTLGKIVVALAASDLNQAELIARLIPDEFQKVSALTHIAKIRLQGGGDTTITQSSFRLRPR